MIRIICVLFAADNEPLKQAGGQNSRLLSKPLEFEGFKVGIVYLRGSNSPPLKLGLCNDERFLCVLHYECDIKEKWDFPKGQPHFLALKIVYL